MNTTQKAIIENYIKSYNAFDVQSMIRDLHSDVVFENVSNGQVDLTLNGLEAFTNQAESAKAYFSEREQSILSWDFNGEEVTIEIAYQAILAMDFPNGMKSGDTLELQGQSVFTFEGDKIIKIQDRS